MQIIQDEFLVFSGSPSAPVRSPLLPPVTPRRSKAPTRLEIPLSEVGTKNFVLDTNVLLHDPQSLYHFEDNHVWIPVEVLAELDKFKSEATERGNNARRVHRQLTELFQHDAKLVTEGAPTPNGGTVRLLVSELLADSRRSPVLQRFQRIFPDLGLMDHRILACCLCVQGRYENQPTILVTKDLNMQLKALVLGLEVEDYLTDKVEAKDAESYELKRVSISAAELQRFASTRSLTLEEGRCEGMLLNEYVLLAASETKTMPARYFGERTFQRLETPESIRIPRGIEIRPMNLGQQCFLDALLDPRISLVTCYGTAGTGKTLLAVAAGLSKVYESQFDGLTISRPVVPMGDSVGFLPGSLNEKMKPWLQCVYDALEVLLPCHLPKAPAFQNKKQAKKDPRANSVPAAPAYGVTPIKPYEKLVEQGLLEIEALCYIRGRSIPRRFFILDEAQQLTPLEAKTVVTRMSRGAKLIMVGDPAQIDNPYVDSRSNGLVYTRNRLKDQAITAHISLSKGERSPLAEVGAKMM
jgi:PhoH-like ATPase